AYQVIVDSAETISSHWMTSPYPQQARASATNADRNRPCQVNIATAYGHSRHRVVGGDTRRRPGRGDRPTRYGRRRRAGDRAGLGMADAGGSAADPGAASAGDRGSGI